MRSYLACFIAIACLTTACTRPTLSGSAQVQQPAPQVALLELWSNPTDLAQRDLLWGSSRKANAPSKDDVYTVLALDTTGYSKGYDVKGPDGREWDIKVGKEVQSEIVLSRILWALGYHQPETYYVTGWQLAGTWDIGGRAREVPSAIRSRERRRMGVAGQPLCRHSTAAGADCHQPPAEQPRSQDEQQPRVSPDAIPGRSHVVDTSSRTWVLPSESRAGFPTSGALGTTSTTTSTQSDQEGQRLERSTRLSRPARRHPRRDSARPT